MLPNFVVGLLFAFPCAGLLLSMNGTLFATERDKSTMPEFVLPRVLPKSPDEALVSFEVADGFRIELVAAEPLVVDPVAMAFDEQGGLFVVEMRDYSEQDKERLGRVRRLTDDDGDGRFDRSTAFVDGLSWPTAVACYGGGVLPEYLRGSLPVSFRNLPRSTGPSGRDLSLAQFGRAPTA